MRVQSSHTDVTLEWGRLLGSILEPGDFIALNGDLGSGKTLLVKGIAQGLGVDGDEVTSPTFGFVQEYKGKVPLYHFDVYRLDVPEQLEDLGYEEYFFGHGVTIVEWADTVRNYYPEDYLQIDFRTLGTQTRELTVTATGERSSTLLEEWKGLISPC